MATQSSWVAGSFLALAVTMPAAGASGSRLTTCVVSQTELLQRFAPAMNAGAQLQQTRQKAQADFDAAVRDIDAEARVLDALKNSLPAAVVQTRAQEITSRRLALQRKTDAINRSLFELNDQLGGSVMQRAAPIIHDVAQVRGCRIVFPRETALQIIDPSLDLTETVLEKLRPVPVPVNATR